MGIRQLFRGQCWDLQVDPCRCFSVRRLVNRHFDAVGMPEIVRAGLKDDRGVVPLHVAVTGIVARSLLIAGSIMPLLEAAGCIVPGKVGIAS